MSTVNYNCQPTPAPENGLTLAIATVPIQPWEKIYDPATALKQGTIFPSLDMPFYVTDRMGGVKGG